MKKYILIFSGLVLLYGCVGNNRNLQQKLIDDKINAGLKSGEHYDTVFLGLCLGDSLKAVHDDLRMLVDNKKLVINSSGQYQYNFLIPGPGDSIVRAQAILSEDYYRDKLYQLILRVGSNDPSISFPPVLELNLLDIYTKKYGDDYISSNTKIKEYNNYKDYYWVKGNRLIELGLSRDGVIVTYTDMITRKLIDSSGLAEETLDQE